MADETIDGVTYLDNETAQRFRERVKAEIPQLERIEFLEVDDYKVVRGIALVNEETRYFNQFLEPEEQVDDAYIDELIQYLREDITNSSN